MEDAIKQELAASRAALSETEMKLWDMLKENTGRCLVDSGGAYGRMWERNQAVDFKKRPAYRIEAYRSHDGKVEVVAYYDLFHWLSERITYQPILDKHFRGWIDKNWGDINDWDEMITKWVEKYFPNARHPFDRSEDELLSGYTYNEENCLSQDFIYNIFKIGDSEKALEKIAGQSEIILLLRIHGGCDARWGFTEPAVFSVRNIRHGGIYEFCDWRRIRIFPDTPKDYDGVYLEWDQEDSYGNYFADSDHRELTAEECEELGILDSINDYEYSDDPVDKGKGKIYVENYIPYCPITGFELMAG